MDFDVFFTIVFLTASLCFVFWVGLALTGSSAQKTQDETKPNITENLATELYRHDSSAAFRAQREQVR